MSFFQKTKTPVQNIDYDINPENWDGTETSTAARLSFQRMKHKESDAKRQQSIREKPWYIDIPYFLKSVVPDGDTFKITDVEPQIQGRFYGKTPEDSKQTFELYYKIIKENEQKKLDQKLKEMKAKKVVQATQTAQAILETATPPPTPEITTALSQDIMNPNPIPTPQPVNGTTPTADPTPLENNSPFGGLQVNATNGPAVRTSRKTTEEIAASKAASQARKAQRKTAKKGNTTNALPTQTFTNKNVNALASQQAMATSAERALRGPSSLTNPMALQRNKLRAAQASKTGKVPTQTRKINSKRLRNARSFASSQTAFGRRQTILAKDAEQNVNTQISTMFNGGGSNNVTKKNSRQIITKV
jgi:hypothetical protein